MLSKKREPAVNCKSRHAVLIILLLFAAFTALSWLSWANPMIDSGREMNTPLRLLQGERLYTDVYFLFGPVTPYFNSFLYRIFGVHCNTLYGAGLAGGLLLSLLIFHLGRTFMSPLEAMLASLTVLMLCVFRQNGNVIFAYSFAVLYGTLLGTLSLAALAHYVRSYRLVPLIAGGMLAGLAFCCKMEFGFAAAVALGTTVYLSPAELRIRRAGVALLSLAVAPALIYGSLLMRVPAGLLIKDTFLFPWHIPSEILYFNRIRLGLHHPGRTLGEMISGLALFIGAAGFLSLAGMRMAGEPALSSPLARGAKRIWWITGISLAWLVAALLIFGTRWNLNPFRTLPILSLAMICFYFFRQDVKSPSARALLLVSVYSLAVLTRIITKVPAGSDYGAGMIPVPLLLFIYMIGSDFGFLSAETGRCRRVVASATLCVAVAAALGVFAWRLATTPLVPIKTDRGEVRLDRARAPAMQQALDFIARESKPGEYVVAFPEGSSLNFLSSRPVPVRYEIMTPGYLTAEKEQFMLRKLQEKNVRYIFLFNRATGEFGPAVFGRDYCRATMEWVESNYELAAIFGEHVSPGMQIGDRIYFIKCYRKVASDSKQ
jgi:hypothetical protein